MCLARHDFLIFMQSLLRPVPHCKLAKVYILLQVLAYWSCTNWFFWVLTSLSFLLVFPIFFLNGTSSPVTHWDMHREVWSATELAIQCTPSYTQSYISSANLFSFPYLIHHNSSISLFDSSQLLHFCNCDFRLKYEVFVFTRLYLGSRLSNFTQTTYFKKLETFLIQQKNIH